MSRRHPQAEVPFLPDDGRPELASFFLSSIQKSFGYFAFLFFMAYVIAALVEESIKWGVVQCKCPFRCCLPVVGNITPGVTHPMSIVVYVLAGGLGFSTVENIFYTCSSHVVIADLSVGEKFLNCMERVLFAVPARDGAWVKIWRHTPERTWITLVWPLGPAHTSRIRCDTVTVLEYPGQFFIAT